MKFSQNALRFYTSFFLSSKFKRLSINDSLFAFSTLCSSEFGVKTNFIKSFSIKKFWTIYALDI